jgi:hypothetical protein
MFTFICRRCKINITKYQDLRGHNTLLSYTRILKNTLEEACSVGSTALVYLRQGRVLTSAVVTVTWTTKGIHIQSKQEAAVVS